VVVVYNSTAYQSGNASLDAALCAVTNPDGSTPFSMYCNTAAANEKGSTPSTSTGGSGTSTSTTTTPTNPTTSTTVPSAPTGSSAQDLLAQAQAQFEAATAAEKAGNLGGYATAIGKAEQLVAQAQSLLGKSTTTTTTPTTKPTTSASSLPMPTTTLPSG
jgi:hypothetical protein